ncbi:hypothetical protein MJD09_12195 [bacterium]|nr:hypothetical protein [bacterium]
MKQIMYTMQFKGQAAPTNEEGTVLKAHTSSPSCRITTTVGADGLSGTLQPTEGREATFESEVRITGEGLFDENGTITFGTGNRLHFSTVGQGHLGPSADPQLQHGTVMWKIDRGEGQFEGATGLITSNFFVGDGGEVTDHHFGVIFLK